MSTLPSMIQPAWPGTLVFVALVLGLCAWLVVAAGRAGAVAGESAAQQRRVATLTAVACAFWLAVTGLMSASGLLARPTMPPPLALFMLVSLAVPLAAACSPFGARLVRGVPIAVLVGAQAFRLPLELVLHSWKDQGVLPIQMTFEGRNFDIITGVMALSLSLWLRRGAPTKTPVWIVNVVGFALLLNVASIAILSSPLPIRHYLNDPPVLLAFHFPYAWIVPFCVGGALFLHVLTFRWLLWSTQPRAATTAVRTA